METLAQEPIIKQWLYGNGWTIQEASKALGCHKGHLSLVLSGKRKSERLIKRVYQLPFKELELRKIKK